MYSVQNLTNRPVAFQGTVIAPYGSATFAVFTDYITLARLSNSGKIRYCQIQNNVEEKKVEIKEEKIKVAEEPKVVEPVETVVDETPVEQEPEVVTSKLFEVENISDTAVDTDVETTDEDIKETPKTKKRSKKNTQ